MESRWETLEACEEAVGDRGRVRFSTSHLSLVEVGEGELIRVGSPFRAEFVDWRYGLRLSGGGKGPGFWARMLSRLPSPPVGGYDPYRGFEGALRSQPWMASPFLDRAAFLTYLFSHVPLAPACPACGRALALEPWNFQEVRLLSLADGPGILASCALCASGVTVPLREARPVLRMALAMVTPVEDLRTTASEGARELDGLGGPHAYLAALAKRGGTVGEMDLPTRSGLVITLDEIAEMEALEAEWREAEEMAAIMDGELSDVRGFDAFRRRVLGEEG